MERSRVRAPRMATFRTSAGSGAAGEPDAQDSPAGVEPLLAALLDVLPALALRRSGPARVEPVAGACLELTGWEPSDFASGAVDFAARIHADERARVARVLEEARDASGSYRVEYRFETRSGGLRRLRECGLCAPDGTCSALALDVTRERTLEAQLFESQKHEAAGRLADGVAHDFNNLLTAILGYSDLLADSLPEGGTQRAQARQVVHAAQRAAELSRRLLLFTRRPLSPAQPFDLAELVRSLDPLLRRLLGEDIELVTASSTDTGPVEGDPGRIEQALAQLAVRARLRMPGGGRLALETREVARASGAWVQITVTDSGPGTAAGAHELQEGPGLASCRALVEQAGGKLGLERTQAGGTAVTLSLPRSVAPRPSERIRRPAPAPVGGSETVLLVEDDPLVSRIAAESLAHLGYEVLAARSGVEALELLERRGAPVQLLVTDVVLPHMSGGEVARRVLARSPATRVLFVSGWGERSGDRPGAASFLAKPFTAAELGAAVRAALDGSSTS
jgi:two-component system cell cycle sensor histidine kinase/response regulator CckA